MMAQLNMMGDKFKANRVFCANWLQLNNSPEETLNSKVKLPLNDVELSEAMTCCKIAVWWIGDTSEQRTINYSVCV